jgi:hypothetical protein
MKSYNKKIHMNLREIKSSFSSSVRRTKKKKNSILNPDKF